MNGKPVDKEKIIDTYIRVVSNRPEKNVVYEFDSESEFNTWIKSTGLAHLSEVVSNSKLSELRKLEGSRQETEKE